MCSYLLLQIVKMSKKRVWCPKKSVPSPEDSCEDTSTIQSAYPRRRTAKIERRKEPTVDVRRANTSALPEKPHHQKKDKGYSTIESVSYNNLDLYDHLLEEPEPSSNVLCGWRNNEHAKFKGNIGNFFSTTRNNLQSREISSRLYSSRLSSRLNRKRDQYCFQHLDNVEDYLVSYNAHCSYSYLILKKDSTMEEEEQQDSTCETLTSVFHTKKVRERPTLVPRTSTASSESKLHSVEESHLQSLAFRLGIQESIREPQLLQSPHPTPPSITKRRNDKVVGLEIAPQQTKGPEAKSSNATTQKSKQSTRRSRQSNDLHHFPALTKAHPRKSNTSTISLTKYLHINTNQQDKKGADNKQNDLEVLECDSGSYLSSSSSNLVEDQTKEQETTKHDSSWPTFLAVDSNDGSIAKDEVIRRKANSLGLLSHKWAKNFVERGFMNGYLPRKLYYDYSRPVTRDNARDEESEQNTITKDNNVSSRTAKHSSGLAQTDSHTDRAGAQSRTGARSRTGAQSRTDKLHQLETVYGSKRHCVSSSAATGKPNKINSNKLQQSTKGKTEVISRPPSRSISLPTGKKHVQIYDQSNSRPHLLNKAWHVEGEKWRANDLYRITPRLSLSRRREHN